jgi:hypothetical protein
MINIFKLTIISLLFLTIKVNAQIDSDTNFTESFITYWSPRVTFNEKVIILDTNINDKIIFISDSNYNIYNLCYKAILGLIGKDTVVILYDDEIKFENDSDFINLKYNSKYNLEIFAEPYLFYDEIIRKNEKPIIWDQGLPFYYWYFKFNQNKINKKTIELYYNKSDPKTIKQKPVLFTFAIFNKFKIYKYLEIKY